MSLNNYLSLPNKIFEYIAAGLPVVASDFPDMAELVSDYDVGETCDPESPADIARAIRSRARSTGNALRANALQAASGADLGARVGGVPQPVRRLASPRP